MKGPLALMLIEGAVKESTWKGVSSVSVPSLVTTQAYHVWTEETAGQAKEIEKFPATFTVGLGSGASSVRFALSQVATSSYLINTWLFTGQPVPWSSTMAPTGPLGGASVRAGESGTGVLAGRGTGWSVGCCWACSGACALALPGSRLISVRMLMIEQMMSQPKRWRHVRAAGFMRILASSFWGVLVGISVIPPPGRRRAPDRQPLPGGDRAPDSSGRGHDRARHPHGCVGWRW